LFIKLLYQKYNLILFNVDNKHNYVIVLSMNESSCKKRLSAARKRSVKNLKKIKALKEENRKLREKVINVEKAIKKLRIENEILRKKLIRR